MHGGILQNLGTWMTTDAPFPVSWGREEGMNAREASNGIGLACDSRDLVC